MTRVNAGFEVRIKISATDSYLLQMGMGVGQGPTQFVIGPSPRQNPPYFTLSDAVQALGTFLHIDALSKVADLKSSVPPPWNAIFDIGVAPKLIVSMGKASGTNQDNSTPPSGFQCVLSLYDNGVYGVKCFDHLPPGITIEPNFTVYDLIIGTSAGGDGLGLSARVTFEELPAARAQRLLTDGDPQPKTKTQIISYPFANPAASTPTFKVYYLGLGQRFGLDANLNAPNPIADLFTKLEQDLVSNDPNYILNTLVKDYYKPDRNWFIAADIYVRGWRVRAIFNDPSLYGLEVTCDVDQFKGLLLEILYQKLGPHLGVYYGALTLPEAYRQIQLGVVSLTIPSFKIWIYTNGDFKVSVGWPLGPNSLGIQVYIFTGGAGFYFAKLRSGDNPQNANSPVQYNPILAFGIALWFGVGRSINKGVLSAELSLTLQGTFQGILAWRAGTDGGGSSISRSPDYYWFAATVGIVGVLQGTVDLKVISASILVRIALTVGIAFESDYGTEVTATANVDVEVKLRVLFITIKVSFHTTITATFTISTSSQGFASLNGPRNPAFQGIVPTLTEELPAPRPLVDAETLRAFLLPSANGTIVNLYFFLQPTGVYDAAGGTLKAVATLLIPNPDDQTHPQDFLSLLTELAKWLLDTYSPSKTNWEEVAQALGDNGQGAPPDFDDHLTSFLVSNITFLLNPVDLTATDSSALQASIFPMFDQLQLTYPGLENPILFSQTKTPTNYDQLVTTYFEQLTINGLMSNPNPPATITAALLGDGPLPGPSVTSFVFFDYFLLVARDLAKELSDQQSASTGADGLPPMPDANLTGQVAGMASRFMLNGVRLPDPNQLPPDPDPYKFVLASAYALTNQQFTIDSGQPSFSAALSVADATGLGAIITFAGPPAAAPPPAPTSVTSVMPVQALPPLPAPSWTSQTVITELATVLAAEVHIQQLPGVSSHQAWFTARRPLSWSLPGAQYTYLTPLPIDVLATARHQPLSLQVQTQNPNPSQALADPSAVSYTPALAIQIRASRVVKTQSVNVGASGNPIVEYLDNIYQLSGTDDATRELIEIALNTADLSTATIALLYNASQTGYQSDQLDPNKYPVLVFKTNLSTSSQPDALNIPLMLLSSAATPGDLGPTSAPLADVSDFLRLLWEVSVVNATGFYLHYADNSGKGLDDALFSGGTGSQGDQTQLNNGYADLVVLVQFTKSTTISAYHNFLTLAAQQAITDSLFMSPSANGTPIVQYNPSYPAGCIGFDISWHIQTTALAADDGSNSIYDEDWIARLYHLIQFQIEQTTGDNAPSFNQSLWSTALSPMGEQDDADHQTYRQVVPVYRFAGATISGAHNLYAAIGGQPQIRFWLEDIFGNALTTNAYRVAFPVLYSDRLISVAEWPGVTLAYRFIHAAGQAPALHLNVTFDPSAIIQTNSSFLRLYSVAGRPDGHLAEDQDKITQQVQIALYKYRTIVDQYADPNTSLALATTVLPNNNGVVGDGSAIKIQLHDFAQQIVTELQHFISQGTTPPPLALPIDVAIDITDLQHRTDDIFPVEVTLTLTRPKALVDPTALANLAESFNKTLSVKPGLDGAAMNAACITTPPQAPGLRLFACDFESTFAGFDGAQGQLKLATRTGLDNFSAPDDTPSLWAMRWSTTYGINTAFDQTAVSYFTLTPLSTELINNSAQVRIYDSNLKYTLQTQQFSNIDIDAWAQIYLSAVDAILGPDTAAAIAAIDPTSYATLMQHKAYLADAIAQGLIPILQQRTTSSAAATAGRSVVPGDWQSAHDRFEQALLEVLANAYTTSAVVQIPAEITVVGKVDQADTATARLFGSIAAPPSNGVPRDAAMSNEYTLTSGKIQLVATTEQQGQYLNFLLTATQPGSNRNLLLTLLYSVGFCEFLFETREETFDYVPSSWLKFVIAGSQTPLDMPLGQVEVPIPLRQFPAKPVLLSQRADQDPQQQALYRSMETLLLAQDSSDNPIADALKWQYTVQLQRQPEAQDELWLLVQYNLPVNNVTSSALFANRHFGVADYPGDITGLIQALARFVTAYPVLQPYIAALNGLVFDSTSPGDGPTPQQIVNVLVDEVTNVSSHWGALRGITDARGELIFPVDYQFQSLSAFQSAQSAPDEYVVQFPDADDPNQVLQVFANGPTVPFPQINGQSINAPAQEVQAGQGPDDQYTWYTATINYQELPDALPGQLAFVWSPIDALSQQTALTQSWIVRNADLSSDPTLQTNPALIYKTSTAAFPTPVLPSLVVRNIHLQDQGLTLAQYLTLVLQPLAQAGSAATQNRLLRLEAQYTFQFVAAPSPSLNGVPSEMAILLVDSQQLQPEGTPPSDDGQAVPLATFVVSLVTSLNTWYQIVQPSTADAKIVLNVTLFANINNTQLPILQLFDIEIPVPEGWWQ